MYAEDVTTETNPGMARSLGFQHNGKYLCAFGLQFQIELGSGNDDRNECCIDYRGVKNKACKRLKRLQANSLAESEGFEPSCDFTRNSISSHFPLVIFGGN